ncbi:unnamed protein product, partial [Linum tenue]
NPKRRIIPARSLCFRGGKKANLQREPKVLHLIIMDYYSLYDPNLVPHQSTITLETIPDPPSPPLVLAPPVVVVDEQPQQEEEEAEMEVVGGEVVVVGGGSGVLING